MKQAAVTLGCLTYADLEQHPCWEATGEVVDGDELLRPVQLTRDRRVPRAFGEVWCLSRCTFANGDSHRAFALYRGDIDEGPLAISVWNGAEDVRLVPPPAPSDVLELEGPIPFAAAFDRNVREVFPLVFEAVCEFETMPSTRTLRISPEGS